MSMTRFLQNASVAIVLISVFLVDVGFSFAGPIAVIDNKVHDFGKVWVGDTAIHVFKLRNDGDEELKIEKLEITGSYTTVMFKRSIPPKHQIDITVTKDTEESKGEEITGAILHTNDPANRKIELILKGRVLPVIIIQPMKAIFFSVYEGESSKKPVSIINNYKQPLVIDKMEYQSQRYTAKLQTIKRGEEYRLTVKVNPQAKPGRTMEKITFYTNNKKMPKFNVGVNIFIKKEVYIFPDIVSFGTIDLAELYTKPSLVDMLTQTILVSQREGKSKNFQIQVQHDIPFITIKKDPEKNSETYRLDITPILEKMKPGKIDTFIRVKTNDKDVPELKIPVKGEFM